MDVTQLSSVAMKDSGSDSIFVEASATSGMDVYRGSMDDGGEWQSVYFSQQTFTDLQGEKGIENLSKTLMFEYFSCNGIMTDFGGKQC